MSYSIKRLLTITLLAGIAGVAVGPRVHGLDRPWISDVFFYWYEWDIQAERGNWLSGVHNTPLQGYYDSRTFRDNYSSLHTASEWGVTHHFIDCWGRDWRDEKGRRRELVLYDAVMRLRREGYPVWMSWYLDGDRFEMQDFEKNITERRETYQWLKDLGASPLCPRVSDRPVLLVYGRNGRPQPASDAAGFRDWLREKYGDIGALNRAWNAYFRRFDEIAPEAVDVGAARADLVTFTIADWAEHWRRMLDAANTELHLNLPGIAASFDVGYRPWWNAGFTPLPSVFGGPHSYGGVFGPPEEQDTLRFIQTRVAAWYGTFFFDHFKNYYHDWDIRIPGFAYLPDPYHFDRFWVGALMRRSQALLHLSWNEWWEGSNLEPCIEFGKTYCEKNLLYATAMTRAFRDIRDGPRRARVGVILNDYALQRADGKPADLYRCITALRRLDVPFDLVPDRKVVPEVLDRFETLILPSCGVRTGPGADGRPVLDTLLARVRRGARLIVSRAPGLPERLGLRAKPPPDPRSSDAGPFNALIDIGAPGDEPTLIAGFSHVENWGRLPKGAFGSGTNLTVRWTPGAGSTTRLRIPVPVNRPFVIRLQGAAIWENRAEILLDGERIGRFAIRPGTHVYAVEVPRERAPRRPMAVLTVRYASARVPSREDPKRFKTEKRVCNLALDWVQVSTPDVSAGDAEVRGELPQIGAAFGDKIYGAFAGTTVTLPWGDHDALQPEVPQTSRILARWSDGTARDLLLRVGKGRILYVNGGFADFAVAEQTQPDHECPLETRYWEAVLTGFAGLRVPRTASGPVDVAGVRMEAGWTDLVATCNYAASERAEAAPSTTPLTTLRVPVPNVPLAEVRILSSDGRVDVPLEARRDGQWWTVRLPVRYYALVAFVHAPAAVQVDRLEAVPGETLSVPLEIRNLLADRTVEVTCRVSSVLPSLRGEPVAAVIPPGGTQRVQAPVAVRSDADTGRKTVTIEVSWDQGKGKKTAYFFRPLYVLEMPELNLVSDLSWNGNRVLRYGQRDWDWVRSAPAQRLRVILNGRTFPLRDLNPGQTLERALGPCSRADEPHMETVSAKVIGYARTRKFERQTDLFFPALPDPMPAPHPKAYALVVQNPSDVTVGPLVVGTKLPGGLPDWRVMDADGRFVPCQADTDTRELLFTALAPRRGVRIYWAAEVKQAPDAPSTDLTCAVEGTPGTGAAKVTVENSFYRITIDESRGGVVTQLLSKRTGRDYARRSFDLNVGRFFAPDHPAPKVSTTQLIDERKQRLSNQHAAFTRLDRGPLRVILLSVGMVGGVRCSTRYEFFAYSDAFRVVREAQFRTGNAPEEIVLLDSAFRPNRLRKTYPGFVGISAPAPQPHYGWRYSRRPPEQVTFIPADPTPGSEAISLFLERAAGIDLVRQGFWPQHRPKFGARALASVEYVAVQHTTAAVDLTVRLHTGWHLQGRKWRAARSSVHVTQLARALKPFPPAPTRSDWWDAAWSRRALCRVRTPQDASRAAWVTLILPEPLPGGPPAPDSIRVIDQTGGVFRLVPSRAYDDGRRIRCRLSSGNVPERLLAVYWMPRGAVCPSPPSWGQAGFGSDRINTAFADSRGWQLGAGASIFLLKEDPKKGMLVLDSRVHPPPVVATCGTLDPLPETAYDVSITAQASGENAVLSANLFGGPSHDFPQVHRRIPADGRVHEIRFQVPPARFPDDAGVHFRLWTLSKNCRIEILHLRIEPVSIRAADGRPARLEVQIPASAIETLD